MNANTKKAVKIIAALALLAFSVYLSRMGQRFENQTHQQWFNVLTAAALALCSAIGLELIFGNKKKATGAPVVSPASPSKRKSPWLSLFVILILMPLTIWLGVSYFGDRRYYLISMLLLAEAIVPFFISFEKGRHSERLLVVIAVLSAMAVAGRLAFFLLPQFKPMLAIIILAGVCFGPEPGFLVGAISTFVSNFYFMQGSWTPWQMFAFGATGFVAGLLFYRGALPKKRLPLAVFGLLGTVLIYGLIANASFVFPYQENPNLSMLLASCVMGLPFDLIHAIATAFFLWVGGEGMIKMLERVKIKYGI